MKLTNNKLTSLLGSVVIAFVMTLFLPSIASATWSNYSHGSTCNTNNHGSHGSKNHDSTCNTNNHGSHGSKNHDSTCNTNNHGSHGSKNHGSTCNTNNHGSHGSKNHDANCTVDCSKYEELANKYQDLAEYNLNKYNLTNCYTYYTAYLCNAKKAAYYKNKFDQCKANSTIDCDKYKVIADKYKACATKYKEYADYYHNLYLKCGWACYEYYSQCYMKKYNYYMDLYNQYMDKYNDCQAQNIYGSVVGYVYEDTDGNTQKDAGEVGKAGIVVTITDANGDTQTTTTDATGKYTFDKVTKGSVTITVTEDGLPTYATLYTTNNPQTFTLESGKVNNAQDVGYTLPDPLDTDGDGVPDVTDLDDDGDGILDVDEGNGQVDTDGDGIVDSLDLDSDNDTIPDNVEAQPTDTYAAPTGTDTDNDGLDDAYDADNGGTPVTNPDTDNDGTVDALDLDSDNDGINDITEVGQPDSNNDGMTDNDVGINGLDDTVEAEDTYGDANGNIDNPSTLPNTQNPDTDEVDYRDDSLPITVGSTYGYVLIDGVGEANVTVNIVDEDGNVYDSVVTDADGKYVFPEVTEGVAMVTIDETTLPAGIEQIEGLNPSPVTIVAGSTVDAGVDAYKTLPGRTCGLVMIDSNENNAYDTDDEGIKDVTVIITDAEGTEYVRLTDDNGGWCVDALAPGIAEVALDKTTLPEGAVQVYGLDPNPLVIVAGQYTAGKSDGFTVAALECPVGYEKLDMTVFTSGSNTSDNLQTSLPLDLTLFETITFTNVWTSDKRSEVQPYEQFMLITVDDQANLLSNTIYTTDINNVTHADEFSDLGTLNVNTDNGVSDLILVHRADPTYGDDIAEGNSVTFKGLCYKVKFKI